MRDAPRWLRVTAGIAVAALLVAMARPAIAGLLLRALAVGVAMAIAITVVANALHPLAPADGIGRRLDPRPPADLPRELASLGEELRAVRRRDPLPPTVLRPLRTALTYRLWAHHGLSTAMADDDGPIRAMVSPNAYLLLQPPPTASEGPVIPGSALPALIEEIERL